MSMYAMRSQAIHSQDPDVECIPIRCISLAFPIALPFAHKLRQFTHLQFHSIYCVYFSFCFVCRCRSSCAVHLITHHGWKWPFRVMRAHMCKLLVAFDNVFDLCSHSYQIAALCVALLHSSPARFMTSIGQRQVSAHFVYKFRKTICMHSMREIVCDCWVTETEEIEKIVFTWPFEANRTMLTISKQRQTSECEWHLPHKIPKKRQCFSIICLTHTFRPIHFGHTLVRSLLSLCLLHLRWVVFFPFRFCFVFFVCSILGCKYVSIDSFLFGDYVFSLSLSVSRSFALSLFVVLKELLAPHAQMPGLTAFLCVFFFTLFYEQLIRFYHFRRTFVCGAAALYKKSCALEWEQKHREWNWCVRKCDSQHEYDVRRLLEWECRTAKRKKKHTTLCL